MVLLDPHARYLPGDTQCYGKRYILGVFDQLFRWDLVGHPKLFEEFEDQLNPFDLFGKATEENGFFDGTLVRTTVSVLTYHLQFRFPLRTPETAPHSQISRRAYTPEMVHELFSSFMKEGALVLLFLKFVESVELLTWTEGSTDCAFLFISPRL